MHRIARCSFFEGTDYREYGGEGGRGGAEGEGGRESDCSADSKFFNDAGKHVTSDQQCLPSVGRDSQTTSSSPPEWSSATPSIGRRGTPLNQFVLLSAPPPPPPHTNRMH